MKKIIIMLFVAGTAAWLGITLSLEPANMAFAADNCYNCGSGSRDNIKQCRYRGSDTFDQRKKCQNAGCVITGTASCSTAANVKVISPN